MVDFWRLQSRSFITRDDEVSEGDGHQKNRAEKSFLPPLLSSFLCQKIRLSVRRLMSITEGGSYESTNFGSSDSLVWVVPSLDTDRYRRVVESCRNTQACYSTLISTCCAQKPQRCRAEVQSSMLRVDELSRRFR
nr:MAG TPA: hypothetical protein [Caudoviricetes sp.]